MNTRSFVRPLGGWLVLILFFAASTRGFPQCCPPVITSQPQGQIIGQGNSVTFTVTVTSSTFPTYDWRFNGVTVFHTAGGTTSSYTIGSVQFTNAGNYSVVINNAAGSATSADATLTVVVPPANDNFANRIPVSGLTNSVSGSNLGASKEAGEPNHAGNSGGKSVWWSWTAPADGNVSMTTFGSSFDTLLAIYTGPSVSNLTVIASNDQAGGGNQSSVVFGSVAGTTYQIAVDGYLGDAGNISLNINQPTNAPVILTQPANQAVLVGDPVFFSVEAGGKLPLRYQWRKDGSAIFGATNANYSFSNAQTNQAGNYSVVVTNIVGSVTSSNATLTVFAPQAPPNDTCSGAVAMTADTTYFVDTTGATSTGDPTPTCASLGRGVWYTFTPSINGVVTVSTCGSGFDTVVQVYTGSCGSLTAVSCDDDNGPSCSGIQASVSFNGTAATPYRILAGGYGGAAGILNIVARLPVPPPPNDNFANRIPLTGPTNSVTGTSLGATKEAGEPNHAGNAGGKSVWWSWTAPVSGIVSVTTFGSSFDTLLAVYTGTALPNLAVIASNDDAGGGNQSAVVFTSVAGTTYQIAVDGYFGDAGSISLNITQPTSMPVILIQPTNQTVFLGAPASFTVVAGGATPLYFEWRKGGVPIAGATHDVFVLSPAQFSDSGSFSVVVSNLAGTAFSDNATLTVNSPMGGDAVSFYPGSSIDGSIESIAVQPDGKVLIGGDFTMVNGIARGRVARLNADGMLDQTFMNGLSGANSTVTSVAVQTNGAVLIGGYFSTVNGISRNGIARLSADGSLDTSFQNGMAGADAPVYRVRAQADGKALIGGPFVTVNGVARLSLARLNSNGSLDTGFLNGMSGPNNTVTTIALQPDGKILVGGVFTNFNGQSRNLIARLNPDGSLDGGFQNGMSGVNDWVFSIAVQPDFKVLTAGLFTTANGVLRNRIARLNADGSLDNSFQNGMSGADNWVYAVAIQTDGKILIGGLFASVNGTPRGRIARLNANGSLDTTFQNGMAGANALVRAASLQPDGKVLIGGDFTSVNNVPASYFARLYGETPALRLSVARPTTNGVPFRLTGLSSLRVVIQASTNLSDWSAVTTNTISPTGVLDLTDSGVANLSRRFYRALLQ
jgi:uncharacterized delta-60 repeat protein